METVVSRIDAAAGGSIATPITPISKHADSSNKIGSYSLPAFGPAPPSSPPTSSSSALHTSPLPVINDQHHHGDQHNHHHRTSLLTPVSGVLANVSRYQHVTTSPTPPPASTFLSSALYSPPPAQIFNNQPQQHQQQPQNNSQQSPQESIKFGLRQVVKKHSPNVARTTTGVDLQPLLLEIGLTKPPPNIIKERYLVTSHRYCMSPAAAAKTPASYRHLIDLTSSHLRFTDIFTGQQYLCKILNEPFHKVQRAYFQLLQLDAENCQSSIHGHSLIRGAHDIVPLNEQKTYVVIAPLSTTTTSSVDYIERGSSPKNINNNKNNSNDSNNNNSNINTVDYHYEDLHTYLRNKRRLCEPEARALFHQICQTVLVCHKNGIILRDLKLRRFHFIDEARTKLQYESLEGSMILDDPADDTLREKIGCPLYTAPELLCPNATYRGKPADMWSLGVLLYTMLVGQYPFYEKANYCSLITVIRHCQVQIPSMLTRPVRWLLLALLRKNHEERLRAEQILYVPWLREVRPYYMSIPANVSIQMDDDDEFCECISDDDNGENNQELNKTGAMEDAYLLGHHEHEHEHECESEVVELRNEGEAANSNTAAAIVTAATTTTTESRIVTAEAPLLHTCATLKFRNVQRSSNDDRNDEVDMD